MTFDATSGQMLPHGGMGDNPGANLTDTWTWNGTT
jgi:hypothetical protein